MDIINRFLFLTCHELFFLMMYPKICIVGAGPGGCATALKLSYLNIPCTLIDKAAFPRDKVCGDAISGKVTTLLNRLDPQILHRFQESIQQQAIWGIRFFPPNQKSVDIPFVASSNQELAPGYVSKRLHFDNFLLQEVKQRDNIELLLETDITGYQKTKNGFELWNTERTFFREVPLLIWANGAQSQFTRKYANISIEKTHYAASIRAYYKNVSLNDPIEFIELHFIKEITPGYFWIFPLPNNEVNVGLGMRADVLANKKVNLNSLLDQIINKHPKLKARFSEAQLVGPIKGYGLPLGSKTRKLSGDNFMLVGDAGHLIDPLTGEGIGNAVYSGFIAAEQAQKCLDENNFSNEFLKDYDIRVQRVLGSEMKLSYKIQQLAMYPFLLNTVAAIISGNRKIIDYFTAMNTDFKMREQLVNPIFWVKMMFKK
ncbi:MAG: geranylgeranyl reductase family protein [Bacteroidota bacterium]